MGDGEVDADDAGPVPAELVISDSDRPSGPGLTAYALSLCQLHFGASWYYNPGRWGTADGTVPWIEFKVQLLVLRAALALELGMQTRAALLGQADPQQAQQVIADDMARAFPGA